MPLLLLNENVRMLATGGTIYLIATDKWGGDGIFQIMTENCRKISRYAQKEFHLMTESSA
jgi:hypothetical protein